MQLSLLDAEVMTLSRALSDAAAQWSARFGAEGSVAEAVRVTSIRFAAWGGRELDAQEYRRVHAYFAAVVRRRIVRGVDGASAAARRLLVQASIESDLREAGWAADRARTEAIRCTGSDYALTGVA